MTKLTTHCLDTFSGKPAKGIKVDVKTKQTTVKPLPHYECSIAKTSSKQDCDWYIFTRVKKDLSVGWFLGAISKELGNWVSPMNRWSTPMEVANAVTFLASDGSSSITGQMLSVDGGLSSGNPMGKEWPPAVDLQ